MARTMRGVALALAGWLLIGATGTAQSPTIEALIEQVLQLKKQLAAEKARSDELAARAAANEAEARAQAERAREQADQARRAEQQARAEAERALAAAREAEARAKAGNADAAEAEALLAKATAALKEEQARLDEIARVVVPEHPTLRQQEQRVQAARKVVAEAQARLAQLRKPAAPPDVEQLRKELEAVRQEALRAADAVLAERKARELAERAEVERRELARKLEQETVRAATAELEKRTLLERLKQLEQRVADLEKQLRGKPGTEEPRKPEVNRPAEEIKGTVKKVDGGLILLDIGADVGLQQGHTLELFRLGNKPMYLGSVTIVKVEAREAVARATGKLAADIQAGDSVASRIK
jgi:hypothetical protein